MRASRIATRRVRELLPLLADPKRRKPIEELSSRFKHARLEVREQREADIRIADAAERSAEADQPESTGHVSLLKQVIDAECNEFHARYLARRSAILAICAEARRQRQTRTRPLVVAGAVALSSSIYARLR